MAAVSPAGPPPTIRQSRMVHPSRAQARCLAAISNRAFRMLAGAMTVRSHRPDPLPGDVSGPAGRVALPDARLAEGTGSLDARQHPRLRHRQAPQRRRHAGGGGAGMVLRADVLAAAVDSVADGRPMLALTPRGKPLTRRASASWRRARRRSSCAAASRDSTSESSRRATSNRSRSATMCSPAASLERWCSSMLAFDCFPG